MLVICLIGRYRSCNSMTGYCIFYACAGCNLQSMVRCFMYTIIFWPTYKDAHIFISLNKFERKVFHTQRKVEVPILFAYFTCYQGQSCLQWISVLLSLFMYTFTSNSFSPIIVFQSPCIWIQQIRIYLLYKLYLHLFELRGFCSWKWFGHIEDF